MEGEQDVIASESDRFSVFEVLNDTIQFICKDKEEIKIKVALKNVPEVYAEIVL